MGAAEADRTLFVGNLDPRATEELLFELFLQAGPALNVKIPRDKEGKSKLFAFINFKHEESVPYGMNLLNGIKLFGRPLKIQYRSGSSHASQDANNAASSPKGNSGFSGNSPSNGNRSDYNPDMRHDHSPPVQNYQRSYSSPDGLQRQAMLNNFYRQGSSHGSNTEMSPHSPSSSSNYSPYYSPYDPSSSHPTPVRYDSSHPTPVRYDSSHPTPVRYDSSHPTPVRYDSSHSHRKARSQASHPYQNDGYDARETHYHEDRNPHQKNEPRWRHTRY